MNAIGKWLARDIDVRLQTTVGRIERSNSDWTLYDNEETPLGDFDWVVITAPASQTAALVPTSSPIRAAAATATMRACRALMLAFEQRLELPFDAAVVRNADISWISVNSSKPGRSEGTCLVVHSTNAWADAHVNDDDEALNAHLQNELAEVTAIDVGKASYCNVQRWRYANADKREGPAYCIDSNLQLAACGDWFVRGRVESAVPVPAPWRTRWRLSSKCRTGLAVSEIFRATDRRVPARHPARGCNRHRCLPNASTRPAHD